MTLAQAIARLRTIEAKLRDASAASFKAPAASYERGEYKTRSSAWIDAEQDADAIREALRAVEPTETRR